MMRKKGTGKVVKYANTLIHLKPWQILGRIVAKYQRKFSIRFLPPPIKFTEVGLKAQKPFPNHDSWNSKERVQEGQFCFLKIKENLGFPVDWKASHMPLLWQFNLHYFQFLHLLDTPQQKTICNSWIDANPPGHGVGWHPYPTSLRIVNWCKADLQEKQILDSLFIQAAFLYRNLETYIYGNHLLENARALVVVGSYFRGQGEASKWINKGVDLFLEETREQIFQDGGHYERSPMYHAIMLEGYLDVLNCLPVGHVARLKVLNTVKQMTDALASWIKPDGNLPLFNDATEEIALSPQALLAYATALTEQEPALKTSFPESGYFLYRDKDLFLMVDGGAVCPEYLMAHAHADIFSFVLSVGDVPFIVDTGVYEYQAGEMRDYVRSTAAHNTVTVDGLDQVECWGSFRVARRFAPSEVSFSESDDGAVFSGLFSGYAKLIGDDITHRRTITVQAKERLIQIQDVVQGQNTHLVESRLHLHPDVQVTRFETNIKLQRDGVSCTVEWVGDKMTIEESWYCPRFGEKHSRQVLKIEHSMKESAEIGFFLRF